MTSFHEDERQWLQEYTAEDLSRTLVREYLYQQSMFKTLNCFEAEDKENTKKIVKSTVIKMLCINNLVVNNKKIDKEKQCKSLLTLLVQYLRGKFVDRVGREDMSDCYSLEQGEKQQKNNNKEFSMNGDRVLPFASNEGSSNRVKEKNLVNTKRNNQANGHNNEKTFTQEGFYKKKDQSINIAEKNSFNKKSINGVSSNIEEKKQPHQVRPNTAKPTINQSKQSAPSKVSQIYSKLNTNVREKIIDQFAQDEMAVNLNGFQKQRNQRKKSVGKKEENKQGVNKVVMSANTSNSAIGRKSNANIEKTKPQKNQSANINQNHPTTLNDLNNKPTVLPTTNQNQCYEKQDQTIHIEPQIQQKQHTKSYSQREIQKLKERKQEIVEQYFDEFQYEPVVEERQKVKGQKDAINVLPLETPVKKEEKTVKFEKIDEEVVKFRKIVVQEEKEDDEIVKNQRIYEYQLRNQQLQSAKGTEKTESLSQNKPKQQANQPINLQPPVIITIMNTTTNNDSQSTYTYQPTSNPSTRGGMKMLKRTTKPITKEEDATEMIGNDVKLLSENVKQTDEKDTIKVSQEVKKESLENVPKIEQKQVSSINLNGQNSNVREIKLKKKVKNAEDEEPKITSKFKFDENFVDQPLHAHKQKYNYQKFTFQKMTIKPELKPKDSYIVLENKINYAQKPSGQVGGNPYASKKKNEKPLSTGRAEELKKIVYQKGSPYLPKAWHQGFILSTFGQTFYGLKQIEGGPCGIIAALQCYFLKHLMYLSKPLSQNDLKSETRRQCCLIAALTDILWKAKGNNDKITLVIPTNRNFSGPKLQFTSLTEVQIEAQSFESVYQVMWNYKSSFVGQSNHGVLVIIYSIIMTKGIDKIYHQVDVQQNPLIGHHGHCTQQLVNLFITGQASSNCFDGTKHLQENFALHGISDKSQFGFLTVFQTLQYIEVGKNLKNPIFPIWVISKQFHYHVIFGNHFLISENNDCEKFDLVYFDGLYACDKFIRLTFDQVEKDEFGMVKELGNVKNLPLIEQVLLKKWGRRQVDWNGSTKIL